MVGPRKINLLDLLISIENKRYEFDIFMKATILEALIHDSFFCPKTRKIAAFNFMAHYLVKIPFTDSNTRKQIAIMKHLASSNDVNIDIDRPTHMKINEKYLDWTTSIHIVPRPFVHKDLNE